MSQRTNLMDFALWYDRFLFCNVTCRRTFFVSFVLDMYGIIDNRVMHIDSNNSNKSLSRRNRAMSREIQILYWT